MPPVTSRPVGSLLTFRKAAAPPSSELSNRRTVELVSDSEDTVDCLTLKMKALLFSETSVTTKGWNFNFGNNAVTFDTAHLQSSYFHRPSMYSPKLRRTRSQQ